MTKGREISPEDLLLFLRSLPVLSKVDTRDLALLAVHVRERHFARGERITARGRPLDASYIVVEGLVATDEPSIPQVRTGESFGALEVLADDPMGVDARAESEVLALEVDARHLIGVLSESFALYENVLKELCRGLIDGGVVRLSALAAAPVIAVGGDYGTRLGVLELLVATLPFAVDHMSSLAELEDHYRIERYDAGALLWSAGDSTDASGVLLSGEIICSSGDEVVELVAGQSIQGLEALADRPVAYRGVAKTDVVIGRLPVGAFLDRLEDDPAFAVATLRWFSAQILGFLRSLASP